VTQIAERMSAINRKIEKVQQKIFDFQVDKTKQKT